MKKTRYEASPGSSVPCLIEYEEEIPDAIPEPGRAEEIVSEEIHGKSGGEPIFSGPKAKVRGRK